MTLEEAHAAIGGTVVYRPPHVPASALGEEGVITSVNDRFVFVRYGVAGGSKATLAADLSLVTGGAKLMPARQEPSERDAAADQ